MGSDQMRVVLSTYDSRGGMEPLGALAVRLREIGADVVLCGPADCAERLAELGVPLVPVGLPVHELVHGPTPPTAADIPRRAAELMAAQFELLAPVAEGCDLLVTSGLMSVVAAVRSVAELLGVRSVKVAWCPIFLPSPQFPPFPPPGRPFPPGETDRRVLTKFEADGYNDLFGPPLNAHRAAAGLPPVDDVRAHVLGDQVLLAADPVLAPWEGGDVDVVQTGSWFVPDERPLSAALEAFLDAGEPPVYVSLGSLRAPDGFARVAIDAVRAQGRRVVLGSGWAGLEPVDDRDDCFAVGEVNHQALFRRVAAIVHHGGAGTTATATRSGTPQVVVPQMMDQPYWAGRVAALGAGVAHDGPLPTVGSLSAALARALSPEMRARAAAVAATMRSDGAAVAAAMLVDAVEHDRPLAPA
jgi:vancomycin aglycone glucosyltransferase